MRGCVWRSSEGSLGQEISYGTRKEPGAEIQEEHSGNGQDDSLKPLSQEPLALE